MSAMKQYFFGIAVLAAAASLLALSGDRSMRGTSGRLTSGNLPDASVDARLSNAPSIDFQDGFATNGVAGFRGERPLWVGLVPTARLGNQMFEHASALGLMMSIDDRPARLCYQLPQPWKKGGDQYSNHMDRITGYFEGPFTATCPPGVVLAGQKFVRFHETGPGAYTPLDLDRVGDSDGVSLMGSYLQSYKYFEQILPSVKQIFTFNEDIQAAADTHLKNLVAGASPDAEPERVVGIHIRRGDQVSTDSVRRPIFRFPPDAFFAEAMSHFERAYRENGVVFVVTSDDLDWAHASKVFHRPNVRFSLFSKSVSDPDHNAALDLALLTSCDDIIMSLGTFGAWAGLLSGGSVIYYRDQLDMTNPAVQGHYNVEDLFPSDWISIGDDDLIAEKAVQ